LIPFDKTIYSYPDRKGKDLHFIKCPTILAGTIMLKNGSIYKAASAGESGPKNCDEKATINTLFI